MNKKLLALAAGAALITAAQNGFAGTLGASSMDYSVTLADACTAASANGGCIVWPLCHKHAGFA